MGDWCTKEEYKGLYIYESPDGGGTVYRRPFLGNVDTREIIMENGKSLKVPKKYEPWKRFKK